MASDVDRGRVINIRSEPGTEYVYIGRPSKWGNPFTHLYLPKSIIVGSRDEAITRYKEWILRQPQLMAALPELRGKVLGCFCKPMSCHGDALLRLANR